MRRASLQTSLARLATEVKASHSRTAAVCDLLFGQRLLMGGLTRVRHVRKRATRRSSGAMQRRPFRTSRARAESYGVRPGAFRPSVAWRIRSLAPFARVLCSTHASAARRGLAYSNAHGTW